MPENRPAILSDHEVKRSVTCISKGPMTDRYNLYCIGLSGLEPPPPLSSNSGRGVATIEATEASASYKILASA